MPAAQTKAPSADVVALRAAIARQKEANELLALKAELARTRRVNEQLAKKLKTGTSKDEKKKKKKPRSEKKEKKPVDGASKKAKAPPPAVMVEKRPPRLKDLKPAIEVRSVYVGGLPYEETAESIAELFEARCGHAPTHVEPKSFEDGLRFNGIAILTFSHTDAVDAALALDGKEYEDRVLKVRPDRIAARPPPPERKAGSLTIYAGNMAYSTTEAEIRDHFEASGCTIVKMRYHSDAETGAFKGYTHIEFADEESLQAGLDLASTAFNGRELRISHSETAKKRAFPAPEGLPASSDDHKKKGAAPLKKRPKKEAS